jgi:alanine-synthesizing transaminase
LTNPGLTTNRVLRGVRYEIRGKLAQRALELQRQGYEVIELNIGNPGLFNFQTPEGMRLAINENLGASEAYCHQKGIFPAREAVVMQQQSRGVMDVTSEHVFIGNGVSELIDLTLRALLNTDEEVLIPSPDYPLWTASVALNRARPVHYNCRPENNYVPDPDEIASLITPRTRGIVVINPNNPTGAVYPRETLAAITKLAEEHQLVVFSDEIYDQILYDGAQHIPLATLVHDTTCVTLSGLSKIYRACGYRVGWAVFSGNHQIAEDFLHAVELLASLRLCSNVPAQWAVQTALGGYQSICALTAPGGRLHASRQSMIDGANSSKFLSLEPSPAGAMYGFLRFDQQRLNRLSDRQFAQELLEQFHVLVAPGSSFNVPYTDHIRITNLPAPEVLNEVFNRMELLFESLVA